MARNFAQIVFLIYGIVLVSLSRKWILSFLERRGDKRKLRRILARSGVEGLIFLPVKRHLSPGMFYLHAAASVLVAALAVLHLVLGWFSFMDVPLKILNSLMLLFCGLDAFLMRLVDNVRTFGQPFFWYRQDKDPQTRRAFASSVLDVIVYVAAPIFLIFCNFFAL